ncbi:hypothetical protein E3E31_05365 [Thermococcus sp. M39]|uniref:hypothetical protein n=1 Tax=unclassified Thermococcus TaxID=2627626 RepID=UPI00143AB2ED|nr:MULTISPECIES: hypothetical protein [unclassified Thermococcus]NJE07954.1 hypothetical protein [Thermococcus sp. M39]NJE13652.1 hypothetical protein [Thermococcus sp. LS2]
MSKSYQNDTLTKHRLFLLLILCIVYWTMVFFLIAKEPSRTLLLREYVRYIAAPFVSIVLAMTLYGYFKLKGKAAGLLEAVVIVAVFYGLTGLSKYYSKMAVFWGSLAGISALIVVLFGSDIEALLDGLLKNNDGERS